MPPILIALSTRNLGLANIKHVDDIFDRVQFWRGMNKLGHPITLYIIFAPDSTSEI